MKNYFKIARYIIGAILLYLTMCYAEHAPATWQSVVVVLILSLTGYGIITYTDLL